MRVQDPYAPVPVPYTGRTRTGHSAYRQSVRAQPQAERGTLRVPCKVDCTALAADARGIVAASFEGRKVRPAKPRPVACHQRRKPGIPYRLK